MGRVPPARALLALTGGEFAAGDVWRADYQNELSAGSIYALATAALLATQEPFSALAAKRLPPLSFVCLTQAALLLSIPVRSG